jgi:hypothetical protein
MHKEFGAAGSQEKERGIRAVSSDAKNDMEKKPDSFCKQAA